MATMPLVLSDHTPPQRPPMRPSQEQLDLSAECTLALSVLFQVLWESSKEAIQDTSDPLYRQIIDPSYNPIAYIPTQYRGSLIPEILLGTEVKKASTLRIKE
jgi:hypothetical protein